MNTSLTEKEWTLTSRERCLLSLLLGEKLKAKDMDLLMSGADIDLENQNWLLMLSRVGYMQGWDLFPKEIIPRLKGIHRYAQVHNTIRIPWLMDKIHTLRHANIPVMLIKGLALRFYYSAGMPRVMGDYDIAVPEESYEMAMTVLQGTDDVYKGTPNSYHGQVIGDGRRLEIHRWIFKHHGEKGTDIWERAVYFDLYGEKVCVPCPEDMFIHQMDNRCRDMFEDIFPNRKINWLYDCRRILDFSDMKMDVPSMVSRAKEFDVLYCMRRILLIFADTFPDIVDVGYIEKKIPLTPDYEMWLRKGHECQRISARLKINHSNTMTPVYVVKRAILKYRLYRHLQSSGATSCHSFYQFVKEDLHIVSISDLFRKYRTRMHLFSR